MTQLDPRSFLRYILPSRKWVGRPGTKHTAHHVLSSSSCASVF